MEAERQYKEATSRVIQPSKGGGGHIIDNRPQAMSEAKIINTITDNTQQFPLQRYTKVDDYYISDNQQLVISSNGDRHHQYYSMSSLLLSSNERLSSLKSPIVLESTGKKYIGSKTYDIIKPKRDGRDYDHPLEKSECIDVAAEILQIDDSSRWQTIIQDNNIEIRPGDIDSIQSLIHPIITDVSGHVRDQDEYQKYFQQCKEEISLDSYLPDRKKTLRQYLKHLALSADDKSEVREYLEGREMPICKLMIFLDYLDVFIAEKEIDDIYDILNQCLEKVQSTYSEAYQYQVYHDPDTIKGYKINENVVAELGKALLILSTRKKEGKWNFHFASVIAKDGNDVITMENETNSQDDREGYWAFQMYGRKEGQTFHEKYASGLENPLSISVGGQ